MAKPKLKTLLILDTAPGTRGIAIALQFNTVATRLGLPYVAFGKQLPLPAGTIAEFESIARVIFVNRADCTPYMDAIAGPPTIPTESWDIPAAFEQSLIDRAVSELIARLLGGAVVAEKPTEPVKEQPRKVHTVRVGRETAGRRGKGVTTIFDLPLTEDQMKELATKLKQKCGTGGTVKDGRIEIQGDQRDQIAQLLEQIGYKVKRSGG